MIDSPLRHLARKVGIVLAYQDVFGGTHEPTAEVLRELLTALEVLPDPAADIEQADMAWEQARWQEVLPPVQVVWQGVAASVRVILPVEYLKQPLFWEILQEDGRSRAGTVSVDALRRRGERHDDAVHSIEYDWALPDLTMLGYHRLQLKLSEGILAETSLIVVPQHAYQPPAVREDRRIWGPAVQLYTLRSESNWGIGDFSDLRRFASLWAEQGAGIVGVNPLHALFLGNPAHASPYSPSSCRFLNPLYLDVEAIVEFGECEPVREQVRRAEFQARLQALRDTDLVDYPAVAAIKLNILDQLYRYFRKNHLDVETERGQAFRAWQQKQGKALRHYAIYEALYAHIRAIDPHAWGWLQWPVDYQKPTSVAVAAFAEEHDECVEFFEYLQWQTELQLNALSEALADQGMGVGLYLDLAVSVDRGGADGWRNQGIYATHVSVGAPPDDFNRQGQDWGLPPFNPLKLRNSGYDAFIGALRENMSRAGALRIDHVMGLMRLFWIPHGRSAAEGAYVLYPFEEMLGIVALESQRNRCMVIGEDLGTVPPEVRKAMQRIRLLSYRVLYFEQDEAGFKSPEAYPDNALATVSTHDLPTLAGYWRGQDIALRAEQGLFGSDEARANALLGRALDRSRLLLALEREGLLPDGVSADPQSTPELSAQLRHGIHVYLARSSAKVMMIQPEDVLGQSDQVNLPGSLEDQHPNWRRKLTLNLEEWAGYDDFLRLVADLREVRPPAPEYLRHRKSHAAIPRATYRLQFNSGFTFRDATALIPYLAELGVSHVYCSPYLRARPGSQHGYDIIDHNAINPEIGSEAELERFCQALEAHGMSQIMDVVPNHMGVMGADNAWWLDVLENGPASLYADYFDIDWKPAKRELRNKLLVPVLGGAYGEVLERSELILRFEAEEGAFSIYYYEHRLPVAPESYPFLLGERMEALALKLNEHHPQLLELQSLISAFGHLPGREETDIDRLLERQRDVRLHKQRLARLCAESPEIARHLEETAVAYMGDSQNPRSFDVLHALLEQQPYRLAHWYVAADEINYRRFFDIHDLAALRMEDPRVFESTHQLVMRLVQEGKVSGLRIDHPDGLYDPQAYFQRLQEQAGRSQAAKDKPLYLLIEKILTSGEQLPPHWLVHGTTGYDFLSLVNSLLVASHSEHELIDFYRNFSGEDTDFESLAHRCKRLIMKYALASELNMLAFELSRMSEADRRTRDFTLNRLRQALTEFIAWLPVYRTYECDELISSFDRSYIERALEKASLGSRAEEVEVYRFLRHVLLRENLISEAVERANRFVMKLQQYTGAVMAKGVEDTVFYRYFPLISLNEVGSHPGAFGLTVERFHRANAERQQRWPHAMLATSSHDNKRSEDVRARISVLSELGQEWREQVQIWAEIAKGFKCKVDGEWAPSRNDEYLLYQTLIGAWPHTGTDVQPEFVERIVAYMLKAVREAKQHTSWVNPNQAYEDASSAFVRALLESEQFLLKFRPFQQRVARFGQYNGLSQTLLKLTAPGVPDIYQGNELWDFSLVDPDNRQAIDYVHRQELLRSLPPPTPSQMRALLKTPTDSRIKLALTHYALLARQRYETLFRDGNYQSLAVSGEHAEHLVAFARLRRHKLAVILAPRFYAQLLGDHRRLPLGAETWGDTCIDLAPLPEVAEFNNSLTGTVLAAEGEVGRRYIRAREALSDFPVALLIGQV